MLEAHRPVPLAAIPVLGRSAWHSVVPVALLGPEERAGQLDQVLGPPNSVAVRALPIAASQAVVAAVLPGQMVPVVPVLLVALVALEIMDRVALAELLTAARAGPELNMQ